MKLLRLVVRNFRNIKNADISFSEKCNIFYGDNAEGKTNLLEAISLCIGKSFRKSKPLSFIPFDNNDNEDTSLKLWYVNDSYPNKENLVEYSIENGKAVIKINGFSQKNAIDLYGEMKYVVFIPEHMSLIKGGPDLRRDYIDNIVMLQNKSHKKILKDYKNALTQRNALLFSVVNMRNEELSAMTSLWNDILARQGINLTFGRLKYISLLKKYSKELYNEISAGFEEMDFYYNSSVFGKLQSSMDLDIEKKDSLYESYFQKLSDDMRDKTRIGAHTDDIIFRINGKNSREFASQGQVRSLSLVLKLSEAILIREYNREMPVLLLDEILSELDEKRRGFVLNHFKYSQCFITSCNLGDFQKLPDIKLFKVKNGEFYT